MLSERSGGKLRAKDHAGQCDVHFLGLGPIGVIDQLRQPFRSQFVRVQHQAVMRRVYI